MNTIVALLLQLPVFRIVLIAVIVKLTGLILTTGCKKVGNVFIGIKALDKNVITKIIIIDKLPINSAFLTSKPTKAKTQEIDQPIKIANKVAIPSIKMFTEGLHPIKKDVVRVITPEISNRKISPSNCPANGAIGEIGKTLKRSKILPLISSRNCCPEPEAAFKML